MERFLLNTWYGAVVAWWGSAAALLAYLAMDVLLGVHLPSGFNRFVGWALLLTLVYFTIIGIVAWIASIRARRWGCAVAQFFLALGSLALFGVSLLYLLFMATFGGPSEDHFADDLAIPEDVVAQLVVPAEMVGSDCPADLYEDNFARTVFGTRCGGESVTWDLSSLSALVHGSRSELMAYLARHPGWWLHEDRGHLCATRRLKQGGIWNHPLHGYYTGNLRPCGLDEDFDSFRKGTFFQMRTTLGFPYSPFGKGKGADYPVAGTVKPECEGGNPKTMKSCVRVGNGDFCVEVYEESPTSSRPLTNGALAFLKDEFASLKLPVDAAVRGEDAFVLRNGMQPGIYNLTMRLNPGEPGITYLRAYEVTKGTGLSEGRLYWASNERVGWSSDLDEKFLYENEFTIYEGDWGKPYAARIEVWFRPDSGQPERKLLERICKVEGWQR